MFHHLRHSLSLTTYTYVNGEIVYNCLLVPFLSLLILLSYFWMANTLWFQIVILFSAYCIKLHGSLNFFGRIFFKECFYQRIRVEYIDFHKILKRKIWLSLGFCNLLEINNRHVVKISYYVINRNYMNLVVIQFLVRYSWKRFVKIYFSIWLQKARKKKNGV